MVLETVRVVRRVEDWLGARETGSSSSVSACICSSCVRMNGQFAPSFRLCSALFTDTSRYQHIEEYKS